MSQMSFPGIAAATGTRVDSSAKHTMACRVSEALMITWCADQQDGRNYLHNHKMKYCVHKNDLVLNCGQPLNDSNTIMLKINAYPAVVSNLGDMSRPCKSVLKWLYHESYNGRTFLQNKQLIRTKIVESVSSKNGFLLGPTSETPPNKLIDELKNLPYFTAQGFALGLAYASQLSGDTVSSVLIGGMQTVMNGHFECRAGQMIQWYFDFEDEHFHKMTVGDRNGQVILGGMRKLTDGDEKNLVRRMEAVEKKDPHTPFITENERKRKDYNDRELGALDGKPVGGMSERKGNIALPKPYMLRPDGGEHYGDKIRIFAKCISGARPHEMMDVMLMTQSL